MKKLQVVLIAAAVLLTTMIASAEYTMDEWAKMKAGELIVTQVPGQNQDGSQRVDFLVKFFVKADRKTVWGFLRDYEKFPEFMPNLEKVTILKKEGEVYWIKYDIKVMVVKAVYYLRVDGVELNKRIEFKLDKTKKNDIRDTSGYWILEDAPEGAGTIISYSSYIDTGIPAPEALARKAAEKSLPEIATNVRKRIESGGTWKKGQGN